MIHKPIKACLMGGEMIGWALDADVATTRRSLEAIPDLVRITGIEDAEIIHSVWEEAIIRMDAGLLNGKRILSHICNEVMRTFEAPVMVHSGERIGLWIPISHEAEKNLNSLGYRSIYMPYSVDTSVFTQNPPDGQDHRILRERWNLPKDRYIIGNFMRDSRVDDLSLPKPQKGVELLLEILRGLYAKKLPIHVLLAGPRRHWLRARLREAGIPFTFVGHEMKSDDNAVNILDAKTINLLYHVSDLHMVTSRWEGGPRAALEAAATHTKIISTPVGMSCDVLESASLFRSVDEGIRLIENDIHKNVLDSTLGPQYRRILKHHVPEANVPILREIYQSIADIPAFRAPTPSSKRIIRPVGALMRKISTVGNLLQRAVGRDFLPAMGLCFGFWHEFHKPPYGGGNQFMLALRRALRRQGARVVSNRMSRAIDVHICNSAWFDRSAFERALSHGRIRMIHRVDGPIALYRGVDWSEDERIYEINRRWASATVFQSAWSFRNMKEHGLDFVRPVIIRNGVDPGFFYPPARCTPVAGRKIRIISTSWSDNPNKGEALYQWLDEHLDFNRFEYTYVGRIQCEFSNIRHIPPQDSRHLGELLRQHDLYVTASRNEPCSNALLEAMACGLPALYLNQGGHGELVGFGGLPFDGPDDLLTQLDLLAGNLDAYRNCIWLQTIDEIAKRFIELARLLAD